jgi:hypothetical protein
MADNTNENNVFYYNENKNFKFMKILLNLIYLHSTNGNGYNIHIVDKTNFTDYIEKPEYFDRLENVEQEDYIKVFIMYEKGGIWINENTLLLDSLDTLFNILKDKYGFFIKTSDDCIYNGTFGSRNKTALMLKYKNSILDRINKKFNNIYKVNDILFSPSDYNNYVLFEGNENCFPVKNFNAIDEFIRKPYENYNNIIREFQPFIILDYTLHTLLDNFSKDEFFNSEYPITYFIKQSFENMKQLKDYDFVEIGTSNFDTLIQEANHNTVGISVEPIANYLNSLPNKPNVIKINCAISNVNKYTDIYYIPETIINEHKLCPTIKGCNSLNNYHEVHENLKHLCVKDQIQTLTTYELFYQNKIKSLQYLKIDTEGHDCVILNCLFHYIKYLPTYFYPKKILFETNQLTPSDEVENTIKLYRSIGYKLIEKSNWDSILIFN